MSKIYIFLITLFSSFIFIQLTTTISFTSSGDGYTVSDNIITITGEGPFELTGTQTNKVIIISSSCTLYLNSFSLTNTESLTPIIISSNKNVILSLLSDSTLIDSSFNINKGIIFLQNKSSLTITGTKIFNLFPNKFMAIYGTLGTSLIVNDGAEINIKSSSSNIGGIFLRDSIIFDNGIYTYSCLYCDKNAIEAKSSVKLIKGIFNIISGKGKGIQAGEYLYLGEKGGKDTDLILNIKTLEDSIEAKRIETYSGYINIESNEEGIHVDSDGDECDGDIRCSGNCECYFKFNGGYLNITSGEDGIDANGDIIISGGKIIIFASLLEPDNQPIDQDGLLSITGGTILVAGDGRIFRINPKTNQISKAFNGNINKGAKLVMNDANNKEIVSLTTPKTAKYMYLNNKNPFSVTLDGKELALSDVSQNQQREQPPYDNDFHDYDDDYYDDDDYDEYYPYKAKGYFIKNLDIIFMLGLIILS